jgi:hypothetical protein
MSDNMLESSPLKKDNREVSLLVFWEGERICFFSKEPYAIGDIICPEVDGKDGFYVINCIPEINTNGRNYYARRM